MIPVLMERAIMKGWATYSKFTHSLGMFGEIQVPPNMVMVIVDIKWNQFINPVLNDPAAHWSQFWKYNEYQMKIDGKKSKNYMTYRNQINIVPVSGAAVIDPTDTIAVNQAQIANYLPGPPIIQDVYFICEKYIRVTISRNAHFENPVTNYGLLSSKTADQKAPNGIQNINVTKQVQMDSLDGPAETMFFIPPGLDNAGLTTPGNRTVQNYSQDISLNGAGPNSASEIYPLDAGFTATLNMPTLTQPLVEFGIVTVNSNDFNKLGNS